MESIIAALFVACLLAFFWVVKRGRALRLHGGMGDRLEKAALKPLIVDEQLTHRFLHGFFSGLALLAMLVGFLGAIGLLGWQTFVWLKLGEWPIVQLRHLINGNRIVSSDWVGLLTIIEGVLSAPLSAIIFLIGGLASFCLQKFGHQYESNSRK